MATQPRRSARRILGYAILLATIMLAAYLLLFQQTPTAAQIDALAQSRDEQGVMRFASSELTKSGRPFKFLKQNGAYDVGSKGWRAYELKTPYGKNFVVFSTKLTSEDVGEQVFEFAGGRLTRYVPELDKLGVEPVHHEMHVSFNIAQKTANLVDTMTFKKLPRAGKFFLIRMSPHFKVSSVTNGSVQVAKHQVGGVVVLPVPAGGPEFKYKFTYSGVVDLPDYAGSVSEKEANLTNDYWYPMIARWPSTYNLTVTYPSMWTAVAQGEEGITQESLSATTQFRMLLPITYFSLTVGPFKTVQKRINGKDYRVWSSRMSQDDMEIQAAVNPDIIEFYSKTFGPYPFSGWGALIAETYGGGALEAYSYATYGPGWLPDIDAHEPAHTWWGGMINNTYLKSFWNESFASFCDDFYKREGPIGVAHEKRPAFVAGAMPSPDYNVAPLMKSGADIGGAAGSLGYGKGSAVLQMLEMELGTEKLVASMREWIKVHPKGVPGEWEDFEKVVYKVAGNQHKTFFDEWFRRPGWANFTIENVKEVQGKVTGTVKWRGQPYHLLCDVMIEYEDGRRDFDKIRLTPEGAFSVALPAYRGLMIPKLVSFDPWRRLLRAYGGDETPPSIEVMAGRVRYFVDPAHRDWFARGRGPENRQVAELPSDMNGLFIIGSPETLPAMKRLCDKVGFVVKGNSLTYDGTTIDLRSGSAMAVVELGEGKRCLIGLGETKTAPNFGRSWLCVTDGYGRFLRGKTHPKTSGFLTFRLQ